MRAILGTFAAVATLWILGRSVRAILRFDPHPALDFLIGAGVGSVLFFLGSLVSTAVGAGAVYAATLVCAIFGRPPWPKLPRWSWFWPAVVLLFAIHVSRGLIGSATSDGYAHWGLKSKTIYLHGSMPHAMFEDAERLGYAHPDYPLLWPELQVWAYLHMGEPNDGVVRVLGAVFLIALAGVFWRALPRPVALAATIVLLAPHQWVRNGASGLAEPALCAYLFAGFSLIARRERPVEAALLLGFAAWTKNEGIAAILVGAILMRHRAILLAALPVLPWFAYRKLHGIEGYFTPVFSDVGTRAWLLAKSLGSSALEPKTWALLWPLLILALPWAWKHGRTYVLASAGMLAAGLVALFLSPLEPSWQIPTVMPRLLMQIEPPLLAAFALGAHGSSADISVGCASSSTTAPRG